MLTLWRSRVSRTLRRRGGTRRPCWLSDAASCGRRTHRPWRCRPPEVTSRRRSGRRAYRTGRRPPAVGINSVATSRSGASYAVTSWRGCIADRTHRFHGNTGDETRLMRVMNLRARFPWSAADRNGTEHTWFMDGSRRQTIVRRRVDDIDDVHAVADSAAKTPSSPPATCGGRPAPAKPVPVGPSAAPKRRPAPRIT